MVNSSTPILVNPSEPFDRPVSYVSGSKPTGDALQKLAMRIQSRAVHRCGELLKQIDARLQNSAKQNNGTGTLLSQRDAADRAGMSKRQQVTAVRVANVAQEEFD